MSKMPYIAPGRKIKYVPISNKWMQKAKKASEKSGCAKQPTGAVIVKEGKIIGKGTNAGKKVKVCPRVEQGYKTGGGYHLCKKICKQIGHSEVTSILDANKKGNDTIDADLYLYGHWWCCKNCWDNMIKAGIKNVYLLNNAEELFKK